jgi:hypothetical protein
MRNYAEIAGKRVEKLLAIERIAGSKVRCLCDCGNEKILSIGHFNTGLMKSCGCHVKRHWMHKSREYASWGNMIARCHNKNNKRYKDYGAKGIVVCERWRNSFKAFFDDMGKCPPKMQIDRIDNNGIYEPKNCRWVTAKENMSNRKNSVEYIIYGNIYKSSTDAAAILNISTSTVIAWCKGRIAEGRYYPPKQNCSVVKKGLVHL